MEKDGKDGEMYDLTGYFEHGTGTFGQYLSRECLNSKYSREYFKELHGSNSKSKREVSQGISICVNSQNKSSE